MATLWEVLQTVKDTVRRPDLDSLVELRVLGAISACHALAECERDRLETLTAVTVPAYIGSVAYDKDFRVREKVLAYDVDQNLIVELAQKTTSELAKLKLLGQDINTCYIVDGNISFQCDTQVHYIYVSGYTHAVPPSLISDPITGARQEITELGALGTYTDWILETYEIAVIDYAVAQIENLKGNKELARSFQIEFRDIHSPFIRNLASGLSGL